MSERYDVVLYGATGFTGRQTARYFAEHAPDSLRWAIAGRNPTKLEELQAEVEPTGVIVADSQRPGLVDAMAQQASVLLTTAGPFAKYGTPVVEACVKHGVDYVDITGETPWVRDLIDRFHDQASRDRTRIVPFCGFDSIPSDIGTLGVVDHLRQRDLDTRLVSTTFTSGKVAINGGTLDSALTMAEQGRLSDVADELLLNPDDHKTDEERARSKDLRTVVHDDDRDVWLAPFVMAAINTRVVRRSNALADGYGEAYGPEFTYREALELKSRWQAMAVATITGVFDAATRRSWARTMLRRYGPAPGQGPSEKVMDDGFFRARLVGEAGDGSKVMATLSAQGDPGNRATVAMLCESAMLLATARDTLPGGAERGGVLTPATALGLPLLSRLRERGFQWQVEDLPN